ncbi:hypothetical protein MBLNU230_g6661t1 [Neophaeotheca triangularis]
MARQPIYSATYSNVPVYEFNIEGNHVMRRRSDDWINATHILKVAAYDKPARTRILEREVQKGTHEKVQGGYGKYQGTWIPLEEGRVLADRNKVLDKLLPIFDFVPGDRSPPPAPKHATASSRPRAPRVAGVKRKAGNKAGRNGGLAAGVYGNVPDYEQMDIHGRESETPDNVTVASESIYMDDYDEAQYSGQGKRRRLDHEGDSQSARQVAHHLWSEELLDYFCLEDTPPGTMNTMPQPPPNVNINAPIDEKGHTALHWAAAMGDIELVKTLIRDYQAKIEIVTTNGQSPLMRSVMFTNCFDKQNMERVAALLIRTVNMQDFDGQTVFHHIVQAAADKKKHACARYYIDSILNKMQEMLPPDQIESILNAQDQDGNTAITIAARHGARKCIRSLLGRHARVDITNKVGETADQLMRDLRLNRLQTDRTARRQESSSPFATAHDGAFDDNSIPFNPLIPHNALSTPPPPQPFKTPSALNLTTQILPQLLTKGRTLAATLDEQVQTARADLDDLERLTAHRKAEIAHLQSQAAELEKEPIDTHHDNGHASATDPNTAVPEYNALCASIDNLQAEIADLLIIEQENTLSAALDQSPSTSTPPNDENNSNTISTTELIHSAQHLVQLQLRRKELATFVGQRMAESGFDPKSEEYRRLITGALGVREEDVAVLLPEICRELEEGVEGGARLGAGASVDGGLE